MTAPHTHDDGEDTVALVPLSELLALAGLGLAMRRAQEAFFRRRKDAPHAPAESELRAARAAEQRFDRAVKTALAREQQTIPGMDAGAEGGAAP